MDKQEAKARIYDLLVGIENAKAQIAELNKIIAQPDKKVEEKSKK